MTHPYDAVISLGGGPLTRFIDAEEIRPSGLRLLEAESLTVDQASRRMCSDLAFDICEMPIVTYICARRHGYHLRGLPVFVARGLHHGATIVRAADVGRDPGWLEGGRVGLQGSYSATTGVWARGILQDEYGVDLTRINWSVGASEHVSQLRFPDNVTSAGDGSTASDLLRSGAVRGVIAGGRPEVGLAPLIEDSQTAAMNSLVARGTYPINHLIVVKEALLTAFPALETELFEMFERAKVGYLGWLREADPMELTGVDQLYRSVMDATDLDPLPFGLDVNYGQLSVLTRYVQEQQILSGPRLSPDELFETSRGPA